jgi:succinoglycan biosynthesis protein ExoA
LNRPSGEYEVILARGLGPCRQRNAAAQIAQGDILIFFDNDSCPQPQYLEILSDHFKDPNVAGVGGPNPGLPTTSLIPRLVEAVLHSPIAIGTKRARYTPVGSLREGEDGDFIFCNFAMRRHLYLQSKGLDERLCPNEENEFFERFRNQFPAGKLLYDPKLIAYEPRPDTLQGFFRKIFGYGKGRARQWKIRPSWRSSLHIFGSFLPIALFVAGWTVHSGLLWGFLLVYASVLLLGSILTWIQIKGPLLAVLVVPMIVLVHAVYILGIWKGIFESKNQRLRNPTEVSLEYYDGSTNRKSSSP